MTRKRAPTKREKVEAAQRVLDGLLRSPKTRPGLIAAVSDTMSKNFVYGHLAERIRTGKVTVLKTGAEPMYQMTEFIVIEQPRESDWPSWLEPRSIPLCVQRHVYIDGQLVQRHSVKGQQP